MLNLKSQVFEPKDGFINQFSAPFSKIWNGGGVFGVIHLDDSVVDLEGVGEKLSEMALNLVMNAVEEDRIKLLDSILKQLQDSCKSIFSSEGSRYDEITSMRISLLLFLGDNVYIGLKGKSGCYLNKNGKVFSFDSLLEDNSIKVVSGKFEDSDLFLLSSDANLAFKGGYEDSLNLILNNFFVSVGGEDPVEAFTNAVYSYDFVDPMEKDEELTLLEEETTPTEQNVVVDSVEDLNKADEVFLEKENVSNENIESAENPTSKVNNIPKVIIEFVQTRVLPIIKTFFSRAFKIVGSVGTWVFETVVGFGGRSKYKTESSQKLKLRRIFLVIGIVVLGSGLYISVRWIQRRNESREQLDYYETEYSRLGAMLEDARSKASYNGDDSKKILSEVINDAEALATISIEENFANELVVESNNIIDQIEKRIRLTEPNVIVDLKIEYEDAELDDILFFNNNLWVTDSKSSIVYKVSPLDGSTSAAFDRKDGLKSPKYLEMNDDSLYIYDVEEGLFTASLDSDNSNYILSSVTGLTPKSLGEVDEMAVYSTDGSLYFLVSSESNVKKSSPVGSGFSYPQVRAEDDSFSSAKDIEITHIIHTLGADGNLSRYEGSAEIDSVVGDLSDTGKFDLLAYSYIVVLDRNQKRVLLLKQPEGGSALFKLDKQFSMPEGEERFFADLKEVSIDIANNTMYILDGFRIISIGINE